MDALISPRRRSLVAGLASASLLAACGERRSLHAAPAFEFRGPAMGSAYTLKLAGATPVAPAAAHEAVHDALQAVERLMSTYLADSELSRLNRAPAGTPFALSADTFAVLALADEIARDTDGGFDVTVAPLVDAWGFGPSRDRRVVAEDERRALLPRVGRDKLGLDPVRRVAVKAHVDVRADLSAIAKGYGVDRAAQALDALGVANYMVEAGGEVRTRGRNARGEPWQIAIEAPDAVPQQPFFVVPLSEQSLATSGDYRIFFEHDGQRYCHEIDPASGRPIDNGMASVSVVAADCARADALATALMVMGEARGAAFAAERGIAAYFIARDGPHLRARATPAFAALGGRRIA
jgi:thiamine biosynthesis lipoprotein